MSLDELRREIDVIDTQLADLICRRAETAHRIGAAKRVQGTAIRDPGRVEAVLTHVAGCCRGPLTGTEMQRVFREIIDVCTQVQERGSAERG